VTTAIAFDIYGTLINPHGVVDELTRHLGERAPAFSNLWRDKQLEYSFRRGLMGRYETFPVCTRQALEYTDRVLQTGLDETVKDGLMQIYRELPAFADVPSSLQLLADQGLRLFGFSNGTADAVNALLQHAQIDGYFAGVVSVDAMQTFKPDPRVYLHFAEAAATDLDNCWLVSSNPFDVIGAVAAGMKAVWLQRSADAVFDPWGIEPTAIISRLDQLPQKITF
jgi:2-haloacid dehalogenase